MYVAKSRTIINGYEVVGWLNLGQNIFDPTSADTQTAHKEGNLTISPNGDGYFDAIGLSKPSYSVVA